jgi:hypothetical protein
VSPSSKQMTLKIKKGRVSQSNFSFMPFLDILFCAIGIFIIIFCYQNLVKKSSPTSNKPDLLLICSENNIIKWYDKLKSDELEFSVHGILQYFKTFTSTNSKSVNLLVAVTPKGYPVFYKLENAIKLLHKQDEDLRIQKTLWPLGESIEEENDLLEQWRGE